jgi:hypothetical protein
VRSVPAIVGMVGAGPPSAIVLLLLVFAGAVLWSREHTPQDTRGLRGDVPVRLLQWAVTLLHGDRVEWGQAMLGELDQVEGRSNRWRFAFGCGAGVVLVPPWGPFGPVVALAALALGSSVVFGLGFVHFGLATNPWNWVMLVILVALVMGSVVAVSVLLRRPGVAGLGLVGGLFVTATWLAFSGFTFAGIISPIQSAGDWSARRCSSPCHWSWGWAAFGAAGAPSWASAPLGWRASVLGWRCSSFRQSQSWRLTEARATRGPELPGA